MRAGAAFRRRPIDSTLIKHAGLVDLEANKLVHVAMEVRTTDVSGIFRTFTSCATDPKTFLLDVRSQKQFQRSHVALSYNIRLSANAQALLVSQFAADGHCLRFEFRSQLCCTGAIRCIVADCMRRG